MHHTVTVRIFSILSFLFLGIINPAIPLAKAEVIDAAVLRSVLLLHAESGGCATGFLLSDGTILTNAHVADLVCPFGTCGKPNVRVASAIGAAAKTVLEVESLVVKRISRAFDLAILVPTWSDGVPSEQRIGAFSVPKPTLEQPAPLTTHVLGFPLCGPLYHSIGTVQVVGSVINSTTHTGNYGSSGSPMFSDDKVIHGIVAEASSLSGAFGSIVSGAKFESGIVRGDLISDAVHLEDTDFIENQAHALLSLYDGLIALKGMARLLESFEFVVRLDAFKRDLLTNSAGVDPTVATILALWSEDPFIFPNFEKLPIANGSFAQKLLELSVRYRLENSGLYYGSFEKLTSGDLEKSLSWFQAPRELNTSIMRIFSRFEDSGYSGAMVTLGVYLLLVLIAIFLFAGLWSFSLGYVFGTAQGSWIRRLLVTIATAFLFWPLSFFLFLVLRRRRAVN